MIGTWPGRKELGVIDGYNITMTYISFVIFFIPIIKFDKQYFAEKNGLVYDLDQETGEKIVRGEAVDLSGLHLRKAHNQRSAGYAYTNPETDYGAAGAANADGAQSTGKICMRCKYTTNDLSFTHCPMCGNKLVSQ